MGIDPITSKMKISSDYHFRALNDDCCQKNTSIRRVKKYFFLWDNSQMTFSESAKVNISKRSGYFKFPYLEKKR